MIKKIAALAGAGALVLALAGPALAGNVAIIKGNDADATANTGSNIQANGADVYKAHVGGNVSNSGNNTMTTGKAKAKAGVLIVANTNVGCDVCADGNVEGLNSDSNLAVVKWNDATAGADSGWNLQANGSSVEKAGVDGNVSNSGDNTMTTGKAKAKAKVWIVVNSNWSL